MAKLGWIGVGVGLVIGVGCLSDGRRVGESDSTTDATSPTDTANGDTSSGDTVGWDADVGSEVLECGPCDDQDPCTYDRCNPETGECEHLGMPRGGEPAGDAAVPVLRECEADEGCEDGDGCTTDRCVVIPDGCGVGGGTMCVFEPISGCTTRCDETGGGCDDGDACTEDACGADGSCSFRALEGCLPECTREGLVSVTQVLDAAGEPRVKVVGLIGPATLGASCDDGPTCDCVMGVSLFDETAEAGLVPSAGGAPLPPRDPNDPSDPIAPPAWQCTTTGCVERAVACGPTAEGAAFRVWGRPLTTGVIGGIAIMPKVLGIEVEGYCLDTEPMSLEGQYAARLALAPGVTVTFSVTMIAVDQGVTVEIGRGTCATSECPAWVTPDAFAQWTVIEEGDGQIGFHFVAPGASGAVQAHARLFSNLGRFVGRWAPAGSNAALPPLESGGSIELVRLGTGRLPELGPRP
ncbi:MAG: hypothetical protein IT385_09825 [Deltaproteobacteria bacterium]|nr:hypothetical protein [Deltaproteobacteria bacterium]